MGAPHIVAVDLADDGLIVTYEDSSCAFYHESVLQVHLLTDAAKAGKRAGVPAQEDRVRRKREAS